MKYKKPVIPAKAGIQKTSVIPTITAITSSFVEYLIRSLLGQEEAFLMSPARQILGEGGIFLDKS